MFLAGERLVEALGHNSVAPYITLRVGVSSAIARTVAADFLMPVFRLENCRPSIRTGEFNDLLRDLRSHELDLVVVESEPFDVTKADFEVVEIHRPALVAIVDAKATPATDWHDLSLLEYRPSSAYYWEVDGYLKERGLKPAPAGELDDAFLMLEAVASGEFVAFVPWSVVREAAQAGHVKVLATMTPTSSAVRAVYHTGAGLELARVAVEKLIANARASFDVRADLR
jgi:DNA-binding transcriptional LysR family regulator